MRAFIILGSIVGLFGCGETTGPDVYGKNRIADKNKGEILLSQVQRDLLNDTGWIETQMYYAGDSENTTGVIYQYRARYFGSEANYPDMVNIRIECRNKHHYDFYKALDTNDYSYPMDTISKEKDLAGYTTETFDLVIGEHLLYTQTQKDVDVVLVGQHGRKTITLDADVARAFYKKILEKAGRQAS